MARGDREKLKADTDDGYTPIANLLLEALAMARLNGVQKGICLFLWRRTYGWGVKEAPVALKEFARACDTSESYVSRQLKVLESWNVIIRTSAPQGKASTFTFNTRVAEWDKGCINVQGLNECTVQGLYKCAIQGLHDCARVNQAQAQESQGIEPSLKTNRKKDQIKSSSSLTTTTTEQCSAVVREQSAALKAEQLTSSKALIAELTQNYRVIDGIRESKRDYVFIGALYREYGYNHVLSALNKLQMASVVRKLNNPLLYLKGILEKQAKNKTEGGAASGRDPTANRGEASQNQEEFKISSRYAHLVN